MSKTIYLHIYKKREKKNINNKLCEFWKSRIIYIFLFLLCWNTYQQRVDLVLFHWRLITQHLIICQTKRQLCTFKEWIFLNLEQNVNNNLQYASLNALINAKLLTSTLKKSSQTVNTCDRNLHQNYFSSCLVR